MFLFPPPAEITLELLPMRLELACERFSQATGERWEAVGPLGKEVVAVRLDHAPLEEFRTRLAKQLEAKWQGNRLVFDDSIRRRRTAEANREAAALFEESRVYIARKLSLQPKDLTDPKVAESVKTWIADFSKKLDSGDFDAIDDSRAYDMPGQRALYRLALILPFPVTTTIYSDRPTPLQKPLPPAALAIIKNLRQETRAIQPELDFVRVRVRVGQSSERSGISLSLTTFDAEGKEVETSDISMEGDPDKPAPGKEEGVKPPVLPNLPLFMSQESLSYFSLVNDQEKERTRGRRARLRKEWADRLAHPLDHEPLIWQRGEAYVRTASVAKKQLIAVLSDFQDTSFARNVKWTTATFLPPTDYAPRIDGDWMLIEKGELPGRIDRAAAGRLIQESLRQGGVPIDAAADYAVTLAPDVEPFLNWLGDSLAALFTNKGPYSTLGTIHDTESGLRIWGDLGVSQRATLKGGKTLRISSLSREVLEEIRREVYEENAFEGKEATDLMPNGIEDGDVILAGQERPVVLSWDERKGGPDEPFPLSAKSLGGALAFGIPYFKMPASEFRSWNRFRMGVNRSYSLKIRFDRGPSFSRSLSETLFPPSGSVLKGLPPEFAAEVARARVTARPPAKPMKAVDSP
ncbi:hypothetical protein EON79_06885 [bacterium]|nr:MAG: hypothetical protein EON79_06885 [bacterium]